MSDQAPVSGNAIRPQDAVAMALDQITRRRRLEAQAALAQLQQSASPAVAGPSITSVAGLGTPVAYPGKRSLPPMPWAAPR